MTKPDRSVQQRPKDSLSLVVVVNNFADGCEDLGSHIVKALDQAREPFELVFVDDGSTDKTFEKLTSLAGRDKRIRVVKMRSRFGEATALTAGLRYSTGNRIVFMSARVRINPADIPKVLTSLEKGSDLVVGWRSPRRDPLVNQWISSAFNRMARKIAKIKIHDMNSGFFATRREVLERISFYGDLHTFIPVLAAQQGYRVGEEKVEQLPGFFRKSRYPGEYFQRLLDILTVFFLSRYSKKPIHFLGLVGSIFVGIGFVIEMYLFIYRILGIGGIAGRPLLVLGALLLVIGIQMISIGLLGEMIIFTHAGEIEEYNIEKIIN
jgi:glycosyltransferase involved in cell wall biosynthesis